MFNILSNLNSPLTNDAVLLFTGRLKEAAENADHRLFDTWYDQFILRYLTHLPEANLNILRYVFNLSDSQGYYRQFASLCRLGRELYQCVCFITYESPTNQNHYIFGVIVDKQMLLVNPSGLTRHQDFAKHVQRMQEYGNIEKVYYSSNQLQHDQAGLVSCGPICVELMRAFSQQPEVLIKQFTQWRYDGIDKVNVTILLPSTLQGLAKLDDNAYRERMLGIRQEHFKLLSEYNPTDTLSLNAQNERLAQTIKSPEQMVVEALYPNISLESRIFPDTIWNNESYQALKYKKDYFTAIAKGDNVQVEQLLDKHPVLLNCLSVQGDTGLMWAINHNKQPTVELLLKRGIRVDGGASVYSTAAEYAEALQKSQLAGLINQQQTRYRDQAHATQPEAMLSALGYQLIPMSSVITSPSQKLDGWELDVAHDNSCLFWAAALAYLLPVIEHESSFQQRFSKLFGEQSLNKFVLIKQLLSNYNPFSNVTIFNQPELQKLVREVFRNRVVDYMAGHKDGFANYWAKEESGQVSFEVYLAGMRQIQSWGGNHELRAISELLGCQVQVKARGYSQNFGYVNSGVVITLVHIDDSHYHYALGYDIANRYQQASENLPKNVEAQQQTLKFFKPGLKFENPSSTAKMKSEKTEPSNNFANYQEKKCSAKKILFIGEIEAHASSISFEIEDLAKKLDNDTVKNFDQAYYTDCLKSILEMLIEHHDIVYTTTREFGYEIDYWSLIRLEKCIDIFDKMLIFIKENKILDEQLKQIVNSIFYADFFWNEKYLEDFSCWISGLASQGLYLCREAIVYDSDSTQQAFLKMLKNALFAEKLYFSLSRNKQKTALATIKSTLRTNRTTRGLTTPIDAQHLSGRGLIAVTVASVEEVLLCIDQTKLNNTDMIKEFLGWHRKKKMDWNRERVIRGYLDYARERRPLEISYQFQPVPGQLANIKTDGIGKYGLGKSGKLPNILAVLNKLTKGQFEKECSLAKLLLRYKRGDGRALTRFELLKAGLELPRGLTESRTLVGQFNKAAYLICFQEVYRRKNQGYNKDGQKIPELPFGVAVSCILKLIADGYLSMQDVFKRDSEYGVFVGEGVMSQNLAQTIRKFNNLFSFFVEKYSGYIYELSEYNDNGEEFNVAFTPEYFHKILQESDGGESDSDEEDYNFLKSNVNINELEEVINTIDDLNPLYFTL